MPRVWEVLVVTGPVRDGRLFGSLVEGSLPLIVTSKDCREGHGPSFP